MRRFLFVVLLFLLPLQLSWAAVAAYSGHISEQVQHQDHHKCQPSDAASTDQIDTQSPDAHATADHGHTGCYAAVGSVSAFQLECHVSGIVTLTEVALQTVTLIPPDRPQWVRLA